MTSLKVRRATAAFEKAVEDRAAVFYFDRSRAEVLVTEHNYVKARAKLERLLENV